jgi:NAD-dependent deacetylase
MKLEGVDGEDRSTVARRSELMSSESNTSVDGGAMARAQALLAAARRVVVLTGAGISTDSGIPDFRGPQGVWTKNPKAERMSSLRHYLDDPEVRALSWQSRVANPAWTAAPNVGHRALVDLERSGRLHTLVTQNIDELHQFAGSSVERVVEVHGTMRRAVCWECTGEWPMTDFLDRVRAGEADPDCPDCGGIVKSATISFGQSLVAADIERAMLAAASCDLLVCVGSTLSVGPVNQMVPIAAGAGAPIVIVNGDPTDMDRHATVLLRGRIGEVLPRLVAGVSLVEP